ncbi:MAG: hypothetical protein E4H03_01515 [Myxococcales bacterium]|jgi:hypothetical protein|nr:MAG: hypothetical protein E4H03_01515 [Myxococcales bacterium]
MIRNLIVAAMVVGLAACGGGDKGEGDGAKAPMKAPATAPVKAPAAGQGAAASTGSDTVGKVIEKTVDPNVQGCLAKVKAGEYQAALPLCMKAAQIDPNNTEVQAALDKAKTGAANMAAAGGDAAKAADDAKNQLDAVKGMGTPKMP